MSTTSTYYKLIKDLPDYSAGIVFEYNPKEIGTNWRDTETGRWIQEPKSSILDDIREQKKWMVPVMMVVSFEAIEEKAA